MEMPSSSFLLCSETSPALPRSERARLEPTYHLGQGMGPFTQVPGFCKVVESVCVCLELAGSFYLRVSECVCTCLCAHVYTQAFLNK